MVLVPAGSFLMGASRSEPSSGDDERPRHRVTFASPFAVGRHAITFEQWDAFHKDGDNYDPADNGWGRGDRPVVNVSLEDATRYVAWLSHRTGRRYFILSESQWEYVARAGTTTAYWWGNTITTDQVNYDGNYAYANGL
jgi:formylglycine-generating enzyme required for sulfatase activity